MLSVDQINQLAPDPASLKAGREQAKPSKWQAAGYQGAMLWGQIQGSGKDPYQTIVDVQGPAYSCSCPSRKFPCKHTLGLLLVAAEPGLPAAEPPQWVIEWTRKRAASVEKKAAKAEAAAQVLTPEQTADKAQAAAQRAARRDGLMSDGLEQMQTWLEDLLGHGLAWARGQPAHFWTDQVARLTNAQLPGVARMIEDCQAALNGGDAWPSRLLAELSRLHLLCRSWHRREHLDAAHVVELRAMLGQAPSQESILAQQGMSGTWQVLARIYEERDTLRSYRHWLWCHETGCIAQVFEFAAGAQVLDTSLPPGYVMDAELVFHSTVAPQRALVKRRAPSPLAARPPPAAHAELQLAVAEATRLWAVQPWLRQLPLLIAATPRVDLGGFVDASGSFLAWPTSFQDAWSLMALSGGRTLQVFGELQAHGFVPLVAHAADSQQAWMQAFER